MPTDAPHPPRAATDREAGRVVDHREVTGPLDPPMVPLVVAGIVVWLVVGAVLVALRSTLVEHGREGWLWICLAGLLWGLVGLSVMIRHDGNRRRRAARPED